MKKILAALLLFVVACGKGSDSNSGIIEPEAQVSGPGDSKFAGHCCLRAAQLLSELGTTGIAILYFWCWDPSETILAVIDPSGTETKVVLKVSGLYQVKYLADDIVVGSVAVTVIQPPAPKALFSQTFQDSLALNTEVRIKYQVSNCGSLSSVILPGTPQRADPKPKRLFFRLMTVCLRLVAQCQLASGSKPFC